MTFLGEIFQRNKPLAWFGLLNLLGFIILLLVSLFDNRTLLGINIWIKPMKFCISIAIFCWTMAWFLRYFIFPAIRRDAVERPDGQGAI
jgi:hypothetical protein